MNKKPTTHRLLFYCRQSRWCAHWLSPRSTLQFIKEPRPLGALISAARAAFFTSRGRFAHLRRTPLHWRVHDIAIAMPEMSLTTDIFSLSESWLISTARLRFRFGLGFGFQTLWLHSIMQNMFPLTQIQIRIPFP